jgi:hypothetical protein
VFFLSSSINTSSLGLRSEFFGMSVPFDTKARVDLFASFDILPGGTAFPSFGVVLIISGEDTFGPASMSIAVLETDGVPPPPSGGVDNFLELALPAAETTALLGGAVFVIDFEADREAETVTGSIDIAGFATHTVGPMSLSFIDDAASIIIAGQALGLTGGLAPPGTLVEVDVDAFEVYQTPVVPALSPSGLPLLAALLLGTAWAQTRRLRPGRDARLR